MSSFTPPLAAEIVSFDYEKLGLGFTWPAHAHPFYQFDVIRSGTVSIELEGGRKQAAKTGDGLFFPPLVRHGYYSKNGFLNCTIKAEIFPFYTNLLPSSFQKTKLPAVLLDLVEYIGQSSNSGQLAASQQIPALANLYFSQVLAHNPKHAEYPNLPCALSRKLLRLCLAIQSEPESSWTIGRMATECHLSADYFTRCFRRIIGCSPKQFLLIKKMKAVAARLILNPDYPIKMLAEEFGYATVHSFTKAFKHIIGATPALYRRMSHRL